MSVLNLLAAVFAIWGAGYVAAVFYIHVGAFIHVRDGGKNYLTAWMHEPTPDARTKALRRLIGETLFVLVMCALWPIAVWENIRFRKN